MAERPRGRQGEPVLSLENLSDDNVLAFEMPVKSPLGHSSGGSYLLNADTRVSSGAKEQVCGVQDTSASQLS